MQTVTKYPNPESKRQSPPFTLTYPSDWRVRELPKGDSLELFLTGPLNPAATFHAAIIVTTRLGNACTPHALARDYEHRLHAFPNFKVLATTQITLSGLDATELDISYQMPLPFTHASPTMTPIREKHLFATAEARIYELTYRATHDHFDTCLPVFLALLHSFAIQQTTADTR